MLERIEQNVGAGETVSLQSVESPAAAAAAVVVVVVVAVAVAAADGVLAFVDDDLVTRAAENEPDGWAHTVHNP